MQRYEMFRDEFFAELEKHLTQLSDGYWWHKPGECLMSGTDTLDDNNGVMILGLNPGGGNDGSRLPPLAEQIREFREKRNGPFSAYLNQCWHSANKTRGLEGWPEKTCGKCAAVECADNDGATIHQDPHQRRVSEVARKLGIDLRRTVALNAVWLQTKNAEALRTEAAKSGAYLGGPGTKPRPTISDLFEHVYLPIVRVLIVGAGIRHVLCLGNGPDDSPFRLLADAYGQNAPVNGGLKSQWERSFRAGRSFATTDVRVFGLPHPSWRALSHEGFDSLVTWYQDGRRAFADAGRRRLVRADA